jgi:hypothetical protein
MNFIVSKANEPNHIERQNGPYDRICSIELKHKRNRQTRSNTPAKDFKVQPRVHPVGPSNVDSKSQFAEYHADEDRGGHCY